MERAIGKAERLLQIETLLAAHPNGLTRAEIARRIGVNRSTVTRCLPDLKRFCIDETDDGRLAVDRDHYVVNVPLTLHESMALHLAARLMATRTDKQNPHAAAALRKLGLALEKLAPRVSDHLKASAEVMEGQAQRHDPVYLHVLETLTRAWSDSRVTQVWHKTADGRVFDYRFAPYFIEPYAVGRTTHVMGWCEPVGKVITFKVERIQRIELTDEAYEIPASFDPSDYLADAWGIWTSEKEPVEVVLRFHPRVAHRVRETRWHRSEQVDEQADGYLIWRARVAEPQEMVPWIRGWGADVEIVGPEILREALVKEAQRLAELYEIAPPAPIPLYQRLWAKVDRKTEEKHPLICHMLDVAAVAQALWQETIGKGARHQIAQALDLDEESAGRAFAFWAGLHDMGKATPAFQRKHRPSEKLLAELGLGFERRFAASACYHGTMSAAILPASLQQRMGLEMRWAMAVAQAVGGHHGAWPHPEDQQNLHRAELGEKEWCAVREELVESLAAVHVPPNVKRLGQSTAEAHTVLALLSGLTSVADWIGSMEHYFGYTSAPIDLDSYTRHAAGQASKALQELGWLGWQPPEAAADFHALFGFEPNAMQREAIAVADALHEPSLVIVEAPTGMGKTEAALYLADRWACTRQQRGMYVAMPTMATSNQMFGRVQRTLSQRYPTQLVNLHLVHSEAYWRDDVPTLRQADMDGDGEGTVAAMTWFLPRKRTLLASFGVGTVDQTFLSVLQARHFFVRLFGLSHKTLIFDEVHAYDAYMTKILERLLGWLRRVGASVVILSATLPAATRQTLLQAYTGGVTLPQRVQYPAITWATAGEVGVIPLEVEGSRSVTLERIDWAPDAIAAQLARELQHGGCAAVICNRVRRAQEVYEALKRADIVPEENLILFHARFPAAWRRDIEGEVLSLFDNTTDSGKSPRPERAIVVATQVIEQSLDLDFDVMVSDHAPVDLLLQRAGRLHRHKRASRPAPLRAPRMLLTRPDVEHGVPQFGDDTYVYARYVLLRSWLALEGLTRITLPEDTQALVEAVYGEEWQPPEDTTPALVAAIESARTRMEADRANEQDEARRRLVSDAANGRMMMTARSTLEEDEPELHHAFQALTRLISPGVSLVCLYRTEKGLATEPGVGAAIIDPTLEPTHDETRALAGRTVTVTHRGLLPHLLAAQVPVGWQKHPLLRHHRLAIFDGEECRVEGTRYVLRLSRQTGLEILKEAE